MDFLMICAIIAVPKYRGRSPACFCQPERMISIWHSLLPPLGEFFGNTPKSIDYPHLTMYQLLADTARRYPQNIAYEFMGKETDYATFLRRVDLTARAFVAMGIHRGTGSPSVCPIPPGCGLLLCAEPDWGDSQYDPSLCPPPMRLRFT